MNLSICIIVHATMTNELCRFDPHARRGPQSPDFRSQNCPRKNFLMCASDFRWENLTGCAWEFLGFIPIKNSWDLFPRRDSWDIFADFRRDICDDIMGKGHRRPRLSFYILSCAQLCYSSSLLFSTPFDGRHVEHTIRLIERTPPKTKQELARDEHRAAGYLQLGHHQQP
jgi:hypothetical protein